MDEIRNEYFLWLLKRIEIDDIDIEDYTCLLTHLYEMDFYWVLDLDKNLASRGLSLRYEFNPDMDLGTKNCSVLEMMVALSWGWEHELTYDFQIGDRSALWFWVMIENLGLLSYHNRSYQKNTVTGILVYWLDRRFDYSGNGSPFPLKNAKRDQRNLIMWLQINDFVMENVEI